MSRDGVEKVKAHLELKIARDVKIHRKGFFYVCWQSRKIWDPQLKGAGDLETKDMYRVADRIKKNFSKNLKNFGLLFSKFNFIHCETEKGVFNFRLSQPIRIF